MAISEMRIFFPSLFSFFFFFLHVYTSTYIDYRVCIEYVYKYTDSHNIAHGCNIRPHTHIHTHAHTHIDRLISSRFYANLYIRHHTISCRFSHTNVITAKRDTRPSTYLLSVSCYRGGSVNMYIAANFSHYSRATTIEKTTQDAMRRIKLPRL